MIRGKFIFLTTTVVRTRKCHETTEVIKICIIVKVIYFSSIDPLTNIGRFSRILKMLNAVPNKSEKAKDVNKVILRLKNIINNNNNYNE